VWVYGQCLFQASFLRGGGDFPPKKLTILPDGGQTVCSKSFFDRDNELQIYHGNLLLMNNAHRKLFVIRQSKGCKFLPKMHQNTFVSSPAGGDYSLPQTP